MNIHLPYIPELDKCATADEIVTLLDSYARRESIASLNWPGQFDYAPLTTFTAAHSGEYIYIDFFVRCNYLRAENYQPLSPVSQDSCVEFFLAPKCDRHYWNFEFNCIGTINASHRTERNNPTRLNPEELASIRVSPSCGTRPFREMEGMFSWNLLIAIPLSLIGVEYEGEPIAMKGNFYKCGSATSAPHYLSWNPIKSEKPNFHLPEYFGDIILD